MFSDNMAGMTLQPSHNAVHDKVKTNIYEYKTSE